MGGQQLFTKLKTTVDQRIKEWARDNRKNYNNDMTPNIKQYVSGRLTSR